MRHPRNILAIAVVAVALCADRSVASGTSSHRPAAQTLTGQIVRKLQNSFRRVVPAVDPFKSREVRLAPADIAQFALVEAMRDAQSVSWLQSRLPPPSC